MKIEEKIEKYLNEIKSAKDLQKEVLEIFKKNKFEDIMKNLPFLKRDIILNRKKLQSEFNKMSKKELVSLIEKMYKKGVKSSEIDEVGSDEISTIGGKKVMVNILLNMILKENEFKKVFPFIKDIISDEEYITKALKGQKDTKLASIKSRARKSGLKL